MTTYEAVLAGVQTTIAAHGQAQDDGRTDDIVAVYCDDAVLVVPGMGTYEGIDAIRASWDAWKPQQPQRHIVSNILVTEWTDTTAKSTADVVYISKGETGWAIGIVARYHDEFRLTDGKWLLSRRADEYIAWEPPSSS